MPIAKGPAPLKIKVKTEYRQKFVPKPLPSDFPKVKYKMPFNELHHKEDIEPSFATENLSDEELEAMIFEGKLHVDD